MPTNIDLLPVADAIVAAKWGAKCPCCGAPESSVHRLDSFVGDIYQCATCQSLWLDGGFMTDEIA